jgi:acetyl esterase
MQLSSTPLAFTTEDVDYLHVEGRAFQARVYRPAGEGPFPAVLDVHGGQWTIATSSRLGQAPVDKALAAAGVLVAAIDFRQDLEHHYPDSVIDVNYALRWWRANAGRWGGAAGVMGALGSSSGGHLVMLNTMRPADPRYTTMAVEGVALEAARPDFAITVYPILDPIARREYAARTGREDILHATATWFDPPETIEDANPQRILERGEATNLPPALLLQGTADSNVDHRAQERFATAYRASGGDIQLEKIEGAPHQFATQPGDHPEYAERGYELMRAFIARQLATRE